MARKLEETPKPPFEMAAPPTRKLIALTEEQLAALLQAQGLVDELSARRDALLLGILAGAHITAGRAIRITNETPARLEVELMATGNGKG